MPKNENVFKKTTSILIQNPTLIYRFFCSFFQDGIAGVISKVRNTIKREQELALARVWSEDELRMLSHLDLTHSVLMISHDASRTGAPLIVLNVAKKIVSEHGKSVVFLLLQGGELLQPFRELGLVFNVNQQINTEIEYVDKVDFFFNAIKNSGNRISIVNTTVSGVFVPYLQRHQFSCVSLIHELPETINKFSKAKESILKYCSDIVFPSQYVRDRFLEKFVPEKADLHIKHQGVNIHNPYCDRKEDVKHLFYDMYGIPSSATVVLGSGVGFIRKGGDLFCDVAINVLNRNTIDRDMYFVWLGNAEAKKYIDSLSNPNIIYIDIVPDPSLIFARADAYLLTSREDPFPTVVMDMIDSLVPVIFFENCGGAQDLINHPDYRVLQQDTNAMAERLMVLLSMDHRDYLGVLKNYLKNNGYPEYTSYLMNLLSVRQKENMHAPDC